MELTVNRPTAVFPTPESAAKLASLDHALTLEAEAEAQTLRELASEAPPVRRRRRPRGDAEVLLHVERDADRWQVRVEGSDEVVGHHDTQREAVDAARAYATEHSARIALHRVDGSVRRTWRPETWIL